MLSSGFVSVFVFLEVGGVCLGFLRGLGVRVLSAVVVYIFRVGGAEFCFFRSFVYLVVDFKEIWVLDSF